MSSLNRHRLTPMNKRSSEENNPNIFLLVLAYYLYLGYMDFGHVKVCYFFKKAHFIQFSFAVYNRLACVDYCFVWNWDQFDLLFKTE